MESSKRYKTTETMYTVGGTLYKNEIVRFIRKENGHYRVKDATGKIWYVNKSKLVIYY